MNNNISEEKIEIGGKEYTLFLNRKGIINWEKFTKLDEKAERYDELAQELKKLDDVEITEDTNPFELYDDVDESELETELAEMIDLYAKFYWVALYTHHKLSLSQARELFEQAKEEYGMNQLAELANQMLETANKDVINREIKNLKALKSVKKN